MIFFKDYIINKEINEIFIYLKEIIFLNNINLIFYP